LCLLPPKGQNLCQARVGDKPGEVRSRLLARLLRLGWFYAWDLLAQLRSHTYEANLQPFDEEEPVQMFDYGLRYVRVAAILLWGGETKYHTLKQCRQQVAGVSPVESLQGFQNKPLPR
jgi:hypothetical protein